MKKRIYIFIAVLLYIPALLAQGQKEPIRVACVGNSITYGSGIKDRTKTYPAVLDSLLGEGYEVRNFGVSAATNLHKGDKPYINQQAYRDALAFQPDIVIIKLGTNDSKPQNWNEHKLYFKPDLIALVDTFRALPSHPCVFLCLPAKAYESKFTIRGEVIYNEVIPAIRSVAEEKNCPLIDLYTVTSGMPENFPDGIHPNEAGAAIIANTVYKELDKCLP